MRAIRSTRRSRRAGALDAVQWVPSGALYQLRGGPLDRPLLLPDDFGAARTALIERFPHAERGLTQLLDEMQAIAAGQPAKVDDRRLSLAQKLDRLFGDDEAVKCAVAANLAYFHDDPASLSWAAFAMVQGSYPAERRPLRAGRLAAAVERAGAIDPARPRRGATAPRRQRHRGRCRTARPAASPTPRATAAIRRRSKPPA